MAEAVSGDTALEREVDHAMRAGRRMAACEPRAKVARFDAAAARLVVELVNGATFTVPVSLLQGLANAPANELARVEVVPGGDALHWEALDVDLGVPGLLRGEFGNASWMRTLSSSTRAQTRPATAAPRDGDKRDRTRRASR